MALGRDSAFAGKDLHDAGTRFRAGGAVPTIRAARGAGTAVHAFCTRGSYVARGGAGVRAFFSEGAWAEVG